MPFKVEEARQKVLDDFIRYVCDCLNIDVPIIELMDGTEFPETNRTFGLYTPDTESIKVSTNGRHFMDVCRTLAHELVHHRQKVLGLLSWWTPSDLEAEANTVAARIMREYAKKYPQLFTYVAEEAPVNSAGSGAVTGIGIGPDGEPGVKKRKLKTFNIFTRGKK